MAVRNPNGRYPELIRMLRDPAAYPHSAHRLQVIETHISWVILSGEYAYKIKKPVVLGFLDFSTLERRKFHCEEELRLNRRTAPGLYLDVVPIGPGPDGLRIEAGPVVEYAVRMRRFPAGARLDRRLRAGLLTVQDMRAAASMLVRFHQALAPRKNTGPAFAVERAIKPARSNFSHLPRELFGSQTRDLLAAIETWTLRRAESLAPVFAARAGQGFIRECHGDLHLANLLSLDEGIVPFDCIEFNPELRWIDTANDAAFLAMDLMARGRGDLAFVFLSAWLEGNGDYASLAVMRFYLVYRCMVRVIVSSIRHTQQPQREPGEFAADTARFLELAASLLAPDPPRLVLMHGFSGSGKTWVSERLIEALPALRVRSDLERRRLEGTGARTPADEGIESGRYSRERTDRTYRRLAAHCETGLRAGFSMIADATFLRRRHRDLFFTLGARLGVRTVIHDCSAPPETLRSRIQERADAGTDASEAGLAVLDHQLAHHDPLSAKECGLLDTEHGAVRTGRSK